jgi:hypothetical protein
MLNEGYHLQRWSTLSHDACMRAGQALLTHLPTHITFAGVEPHALGDQHYLVAF